MKFKLIIFLFVLLSTAVTFTSHSLYEVKNRMTYYHLILKISKEYSPRTGIKPWYWKNTYFQIPAPIVSLVSLVCILEKCLPFSCWKIRRKYLLTYFYKYTIFCQQSKQWSNWHVLLRVYSNYERLRT